MRKLKKGWKIAGLCVLLAGILGLTIVMLPKKGAEQTADIPAVNEPVQNTEQLSDPAADDRETTVPEGQSQTDVSKESADVKQTPVPDASAPEPNPETLAPEQKEDASSTETEGPIVYEEEPETRPAEDISEPQKQEEKTEPADQPEEHQETSPSEDPAPAETVQPEQSFDEDEGPLD